MGSRKIFVISDLHLGGEAGFQMMGRPDVLAAFIDRVAGEKTTSELVIAGDFVDYLAQGVSEEGVRPESWEPLIVEPSVARAMFSRIARRSGFSVVFEALRRLASRGHRLTVLLGNHDVELSYPEVRRELARVVGADEGFGLHFVHDGEGYVAGDALIEHGNRYDAFNAVDHDRLREARSLQSRGYDDRAAELLEANAGSRLVASVMNPIKAQYRFVDLLKPEDAAVLPLLLALEPSYRDRITRALRALAPAVGKGVDRDGVPLRLSDAAGGGGSVSLSLDGGGGASGDPLEEVLSGPLGADAGAFLRSLEEEEDPFAPKIRDASAGSMRVLAGSLFGLATGRQSSGIERRLPTLHRALRTIAEDRSFDLDHEPGRAYLDAARKLAEKGGFRFVVFGHTHHAKDVTLDGGARYLNTGTWADLMRVPEAIVRGDGPEATAALRRFVEDVGENRVDAYRWFRPTYAELELGDDAKVSRAAVRTFEG